MGKYEIFVEHYRKANPGLSKRRSNEGMVKSRPKIIPTQPEQKSAEGRFLEGKLFSEKTDAKISGEKGRRLTEGFSI